MAVFRVDVAVPHPERVFAWLENQVPRPALIRCVGWQVGYPPHEAECWVVKVVFKEKDDADAFHRHWFPDEAVHDVRPWS
jgi:hypothetical protein